MKKKVLILPFFALFLTSCSLITRTIEIVDLNKTHEEANDNNDKNDEDNLNPNDNLEESEKEEENLPTYEVVFRNYDGAKLFETTVKKGDSILYPYDNPQRAKDSDYTYTFDGWDKDITYITSDLEIHAVYSASPISFYSVSYINYDGSVLYETSVKEGESVTYPYSNPTREKDDRYTYKFKGFDKEATNVKSDLEINAVYTRTAIPTYKVTFVSDDTILCETTIKDGEEVTYPLAETPTKEKDSDYTYTFVGWDRDLSHITSNTVVNAVYKRNATTAYTVTYKDYDGTILYQTSVKAGDSVVFPYPNLTRADDANYRYTFTGFDKEATNVKSNLVLTAQYSKVAIPTYKAIFKNYDGKVLYQTSVKEGKKASCSIVPERKSDDDYIYSFIGWDKDLTITCDTEFYAVYTKVAKPTYTVTFKNYDGTNLYQTKVKQGKDVSYPYSNPQKPKTEDYKYVFKGWSESLSNINSDLEITALFDKVLIPTYTVTFKNYDGEVLYQTKVKEGNGVTCNVIPERKSDDDYTYTFIGFDTDTTNVNSDLVVMAVYEKIARKTYTVTFKDYNGNILYEGNVKEGKDAVYPYPNPTREKDLDYTYTFKGWSKSLQNITENLEVEALYTKTLIPTYTVIYKNYDGSILYTASVKEGNSVVYPYSNPTRAEDDNYRYTFDHFDKEATNVSGDLVITAVYKKTAIPSYTVTFKNYDGTVLHTASVKEGRSIVYPYSNPSRAEDDDYKYTFIGFDKEATNVKSNLVITALYSKTLIQKYTVTFKNYDGKTLFTATVKEGGSVTYPYSNPTRPDDEDYEYTFTGFDKEATNVKSNLVVTAQYSKKPATCIPGEPVIENDTATCTKDGTKDIVIYCTKCGKELSRETVISYAKGHHYEESIDSHYHTKTVHTCSECGDFYYDALVVDYTKNYDYIMFTESEEYKEYSSVLKEWYKELFDDCMEVLGSTKNYSSDDKTVASTSYKAIPVNVGKNFVSSFRHNNPQFYFLSSTYAWSHYTSKNVEYFSMRLRIDSAFYNSSVRLELESNLLELEKDFTSNLESNMTDYQKAVLLHDYICNNNFYQYDAAGNPDSSIQSHSIVGIADMDPSTGGVCECYAKVYLYLSNLIDLESIIVIGVTHEDGTGGHAWNYTKIDGKWYGVDSTWDDQNKKIYHDFFLASSDFMANSSKGWNYAKHIPGESDITLDPDFFQVKTPELADSSYKA